MKSKNNSKKHPSQARGPELRRKMNESEKEDDHLRQYSNEEPAEGSRRASR